MIDYIVNKEDKRKIFFVGFIIIICLVALQYGLIPIIFDLKQESAPFILQDIIHALLITTIINIALFAFFLYLYPQKKEKKKVNVTHPKKTLELHNDDLAESDFWYHHGHFGRWVRSKVLPTFAEASRTKRTRHKVELLILDPRNKELCEQYANYRNSTRNRKKATEWTINEVRSEIYATIYLAQKFDCETSFLSVNTYLKSTFSIFRKDICNSRVFITTEDPEHPAINYPKSSIFYTFEKNDIENCKKLCTEKLRSNSLKFDEMKQNVEAVQNFYSNLDLGFPTSNIKFVNKVLEKIDNQSIPYERKYENIKY